MITNISKRVIMEFGTNGNLVCRCPFCDVMTYGVPTPLLIAPANICEHFARFSILLGGRIVADYRHRGGEADQKSP